MSSASYMTKNLAPMTVGDLRALLEGRPDDYLVYVPSLHRCPGQRDYPIPHHDPHKSSVLAYNSNPDKHWDRTTPYGALRWELLEFCITQLENTDHDN